jgi:arylsulfatase A-like enzyme
MRRVLSMVVTLSAVALLAACARSEKPNIILVVVDSLRADALGCYGGQQGATINIDGLATDALRMERAVAQAPWNVPSISSLLTSTYPWQNGQGMSASPQNVATLAEVLAKGGYRTAAFTEASWPLLERGFGTFQNTAAPHLYGDPGSNSAAKTVSAALRWIRQGGPGPFFVLIHTYEAHSYFLGKPNHRAFAQREQPKYQGRFTRWTVADTKTPVGTQVIDALLSADAQDLAYLRSLYRGAVAETDAEIGNLAAALKNDRIDNQTVLVITSSNGEGFRPDLKRVHHGGRLHDDLVHVPLIIRAPGRLAQAASNTLVQLLDVAPTLLELAGLPAEPRYGGRSLVEADTSFWTRFRGPIFSPRLLEAKPALAEEATFRIGPKGERETATRPQFVLYSESATLIDTGDGALLYDLKSDPGQERDIAAQHPTVVADLRRELKERVGGSGGGSGPSDTQQEQLRSLGYVQ